MYSVVFITNRRASFFSTSLLAHQLLACLRRSNSGKCHSPLSESLEQALIISCFLLPLAQTPGETPLSIHNSPFPADDQDTVGRTFSAPPDPTSKVSCPPAPPPLPPIPPVPCLPNHRCNKTCWRLTPLARLHKTPVTTTGTGTYTRNKSVALNDLSGLLREFT